MPLSFSVIRAPPAVLVACARNRKRVTGSESPLRSNSPSTSVPRAGRGDRENTSIGAAASMSPKTSVSNPSARTKSERTSAAVVAAGVWVTLGCGTAKAKEASPALTV